jgi:hypothetical protein
VRLQALLALSDAPPNGTVAKAVVTFLAQPQNVADRWLVEASTSAAAAHAAEFLLAIAGENSPSPQQVEVGRIIANHFARSTPGVATEKLLAALAAADPKLAGAVVQGLADGWQDDPPFPKSENANRAIGKLLERLDLGWRRAAATRVRARSSLNLPIRCLIAWKTRKRNQPSALKRPSLSSRRNRTTRKLLKGCSASSRRKRHPS